MVMMYLASPLLILTGSFVGEEEGGCETGALVGDCNDIYKWWKYVNNRLNLIVSVMSI